MHPNLIQAMTLRERWMLDFMNQVTDKVDWTNQVHDEKIIAQWKEEVTGRSWDHSWNHAGNYRAAVVGGEQGPHNDFTDEMFQYCIDELQEKAKTYEEFSVIPIFDAHFCILKSDKVVSNTLQERLQEAIAHLEDIPKDQQDWYPGSSEKMLYLVHPSLFPLVLEQSRIRGSNDLHVDDCLRLAGKGEVVSSMSVHYQCLPSDITFPDQEHARIFSYINNLHPRDHKNLYLILEEVIDCIIPFWNLLYQGDEEFSPLKMHPRIKVDLLVLTNSPLSAADRDGSDPHFAAESTENQTHSSSNRGVESKDDNSDRNNEGEHPLYRGWPGIFRPRFNSDAYRNKFALMKNDSKKLQVVFKLANIILTPENPERAEDGNWQCNTFLDSRILSTAIYYYDDSNISDSYLTFKKVFYSADVWRESASASTEIDFDGLKQIFGIDDPNFTYMDEIGRVQVHSGRLVVWNAADAYRHSKCRLRDPTKPGHRKMLYMMLVDPGAPVISTASVPPQRRDWWIKEIRLQDTRLGRLPREIFDMIVEQVSDFPINMKEARSIRDKMEKRREDQVNDFWGIFFQYDRTVCCRREIIPSF